MIKVTFEFASVELAIATLGKIMQQSKVAAPEAKTEAVIDKGATSTPDAATTKRKRRTDAGTKRGSYKNIEAPTAPVEADKAQPPGVPPPVASIPERNRDLIKGDTITAAPQTAAPEGSAQPAATAAQPLTQPDAAAPKEADLIAAGDALLNAKGLPAVMTLMKSFGVSRLRDLPADKGAEFIAKAQEAAK